jgi:hypothetical protein
MSGSPSSIYHVRQLLDNDGAIVTEVSEEAAGSSGYAQPMEVRNAKVRLGGVDSFWLATNVKTERKFLPSAKPVAPSPFPSASATSSLIGRMKGGSGLDFTSPFSDTAKKVKIEGVSFGAAIRVPIAIGPSGGGHEQLVRDLREGKLSVEVRNTVDAIEVKPSVYMVSGFVRLSNGHYGFAPETRIRAVPTVSVVGNVGTTRLPSGILVFGAQVKWSAEVPMDLRSDDEIIASAEDWLARAQVAASLSGNGIAQDPAELLRAFAAASVSAEERDDLESAVRVLSGRSELLDLLPKLLANDEGWRERRRTFEHAEEERLRAEIRTRVGEQFEQESSRLAKLREQVLDAEGRLATISHREVLLRNETEQHYSRLKDRITEAAREVGSATLDATEKLRQEVAQLRGELERAAEPTSSVHVREETVGASAPSVRQLPAVVTESDRVHALRELASSTGISLADLVATVLHSTEGVPVLVGDGSAGIVADIATAIGGDIASIFFCGPTFVSFADLMRDEAAGLPRAIEAAEANPGALVPVALCGLTTGPCEYWLPQFVEMRRVGRLPSNLALFASAGTDGLRVSVPKSVLRYLFPIASSRTEATAKPEHLGSWKPFATDPALIQNAIRILRGKSVEPALVGRLADLLARVPKAMADEQVEFANALLGEQKWIAAWRDGADHDLMQHFQNLGN